MLEGDCLWSLLPEWGELINEKAINHGNQFLSVPQTSKAIILDRPLNVVSESGLERGGQALLASPFGPCA